MRASTGELLKARFWAKVKISGGCWEWQANRNPFGYGQIRIEGIPRNSHRVSWELAHGPIPPKMRVLHKCDNPPCVRPDHLFLGTQADNMRDMVAKGRGLTAEQQAAIRPASGDNHYSRRNPELVRRGVNHHYAKLDDDKVRAIRNAYVDGVSVPSLAREYVVSEASISNVIKRRTWKHVE